jgi:hypothetical protein
MAARRRYTGRILLVVNLAVVNGVAATWIAAFLQPAVLGAPQDGERAVLLPLNTPSAWLAFFAAIGLLLCNFAYLVRRREPEIDDGWIHSAGAAGPVRVAREAVEAGLRAAGEALPEVTRLRVQVRADAPKKLRVLGQFTCAEGQDHHGGSERLRRAMEARFQELVRLSDGTRVEFELEFQGFAGKLGKNAPEVPPAASDEPEPFRGPRYPIDDGEEVRP